MNRHIHSKQCAYCNNSFLGYRLNSKYCSATCRYAWQARNQSEKTKLRRQTYQKKWGQENWLRRRNYMLNYTYGITAEQYDDLLRKQDGNCAICGRHNLEFSKKLAIDHDHVTGEIRGALCELCNRKIIGKLRGLEGAEIFRKAAAYLDREYTGWIVPEKEKKRKKRRRRSTSALARR